MKTSLQWLRTYLPDAPAALTCGDALTMAGLPTETFEKFGPDDVFDVEVTSNRSDCLSHLGIAYELGALLNLAVVEPPIAPPAGAITPGRGVPVAVEDPALCPYYSARILRGVRVGPSPLWLQRHLESVGLRTINNIVDITNLVLLELGQPLHAFDLAYLAGPQIQVRKARPGEVLVSLDGHTRKLDPSMLVIADAEKPVALAGIMGGKDSEVTTATTDILLESAIFDPMTVRKTSRQLALRSDSSYRFERGLDPTLPHRAGLRAARLILELAGGKLEDTVTLAPDSARQYGHPAPKRLTLRLEKLRRVLGYDIPRDAVVDGLTRLRLQPTPDASMPDVVHVTVPTNRLDINIEVDLIEEAARIHGYEHIPQKQAIEIRLQPPDLTARSMSLIAETAVGAGYFEAITYSFVSDALAADFLPPDATGLPRADPGTRKADARLRPSLVAGLLETVARNEAAGNGITRFFEVGSTFHLGPSREMVETRRIALVGGEDLHATRGAVEALLARLDVRKPITIEPAKRQGYDVAATISWEGRPIGVLGKVSRDLITRLDLRHTPCAAELELTPLLAGTRHVPQLVPLPRFPLVERDVSLVLAENIRYAAVHDLALSLALPDLESLRHVTTYRGKPLDKGTKSLTVRLFFRSPQRSLTGPEVESAVTRFVDKCKSDLSATQRI